jgi:hypothetical protein
MPYHALAILVLAVHLGFILFVVLGGLLVLRRPRLAWVHLPAVAWGVLIEYTGWVCPLTPLENSLRERAGEPGYAGGFIEHYLTAAIYPQGLSRTMAVLLGSFALLVNLFVYVRLYRRQSSR